MNVITNNKKHTEKLAFTTRSYSFISLDRICVTKNKKFIENI